MSTGGIYAMDLHDEEPTKVNTMAEAKKFEVFGFSWDDCLKAKKKAMKEKRDAEEIYLLRNEN